jgi:hypothetical protein
VPRVVITAFIINPSPNCILVFQLYQAGKEWPSIKSIG